MRLIEKRKKDSPGSVRVIPLLLALLALLTLSGLSHTAGAEEKSEEASYTSLAELEHQRIGVLTGTVQAIQAQERLPEASFFYYSSEADTLAALRAGKIDAFAAAEAVARYMMPENPDISILPEKLAGGMKVCSIFPKTEKGKALCNEFSAFIREIRDNGIYDEISRNYFETASEQRILPETEGLPAPNGTLRVAMNSTMAPFAYIQDGRTAGIDVETVTRFCRERGYGLEIVPMEFTGILPAVTTGKCDLACGGIAYTDERAESVYFAEPTYEGGSVMVVLKDPAKAAALPTASSGGGDASSSDLFTSLRLSFEKTFIRENRWKLLLSGLETTLALAALAGLFGTLLGAGICFLRLRKNRIAQMAAGLYIRLFRGIPIVVLLLVLNYLVFTGAHFSAFWVCVIGFSLDFAAYTSEMFFTGIAAVPAGQTLAARALGFSGMHAFRKVILPQALIHILPVYTGQFISLVKLTSVAGYISVMDLTRASDIIRSRTYDAFFPLIVTAVIYFILSVILIALLRRLEKAIHPGSRRLARVQRLMQAWVNAPKEDGKKLPGPGEPAAAPAAKPGAILYEVQHLRKSYENSTPLKDLSCEIRSGDVIAIIGPSGTGKSTLLHLLNQLEPADGGEILFMGESILDRHYDLNQLRRKVGMVFQSFFLFSHLTVVENIMLAQVELLRRTPEEAFAYSMSMLEKVGLSARAMNYPNELSGGQQQRVAIARETAMDPELILLDEPTSALDPTTIGEVLSVIRNLRRQGMTMVIVTHEMNFARDVSNRVFYLDEGIVYEEGTPEQIFTAPAKEKTRQFIRHLQVLTIRIDGTDFDYGNALTQIEAFGQQHMMERAAVRRMITLTEELGVEILLRRFRGKTRAEFVFELEESTGVLQVRITFEGTDFDPLTEGDPTSITLIHAAAPDIIMERAGDATVLLATLAAAGSRS